MFAALALAAALSGCGLEKTDFKNFTYAIPAELSGRAFKAATLRGGEYAPPEGADPDSIEYGYVQFISVQTADLDADGIAERIVTIEVGYGGTWSVHVINILGCSQGAVSRLSYLTTGDRGNGGLHRVMVKRGELVVETYDPDLMEGLCCSRGLVVRHYRLQGNKLVPDPNIVRKRMNSK